MFIKSLILYMITGILVNYTCSWKWLRNNAPFNVFALIY